jgi:hypothetical protein
MDSANFAELVGSSAAAVIATVDEVTEPRWNSVDGQAWEPDPNTTELQAAPLMFRTAALRVESVLFQEAGETIKPGGTIQLYLYGSGESGDTDIRDGDVAFDAVSGPISEGDRVLALLRWQKFGMQGTEASWPTVFSFTGHLQGNFGLEDGVVRSVDVSLGWDGQQLDALVSAIHAARSGEQVRSPAERTETVASGSDDRGAWQIVARPETDGFCFGVGYGEVEAKQCVNTGLLPVDAILALTVEQPSLAAGVVSSDVVAVEVRFSDGTSRAAELRAPPAKSTVGAFYVVETPGAEVVAQIATLRDGTQKTAAVLPIPGATNR